MTNDEPTAIETYLQQTIAPRFGQMVAQASAQLESAQRELTDLRAARGTIAWDVSDAGGGVWYLNIADGVMVVAPTPLDTPFMQVVQSLADWQRFISGAATPGFLGGGSAGHGLGKSRIDRLRTIRGSVRFVITGLIDGSDWSFETRFGPGPFSPEPQTTVTLPVTTMQQLQRGELNPQLAFMQGQVKITGDAGLAMQLGMALFL